MNPFWATVADRVNAKVNSEQVSAPNLMARSHEALDLLARELQTPVFYRPLEPQGFAMSAPPDMEEDLAMTEAVITAAANRLCATSDATSRQIGTEALYGLEWLRYDRSPVRVLLERDLMDEGSMGMVDLIDPATATVEPVATARAWGRMCLFLPDEDGNPTDAWLPLDAQARGYLRKIRERFPAFPICLSYMHGLHTFEEWFGSVADGAVSDNLFDATHPAAFEAVQEAAEAMKELGRQVDQNPNIQIELMLLPYRELMSNQPDGEGE